jgi:hypothetical protein
MTSEAKPDKELRQALYALVMEMIAPRMDAEVRGHMLECYVELIENAGGEAPVDRGEARELAGRMAPPSRDFYRKWCAAFVDHVLETKGREAAEAMCTGETIANARAYVAFQEFCGEREEEMEADRKAMDEADKATKQ